MLLFYEDPVRSADERESREPEIENLVCLAEEYVDLHHIGRANEIQAAMKEKAESLKRKNRVQIQDKHTDLYQIFKFMCM